MNGICKLCHGIVAASPSGMSAEQFTTEYLKEHWVEFCGFVFNRIEDAPGLYIARFTAKMCEAFSAQQNRELREERDALVDDFAKQTQQLFDTRCTLERAESALAEMRSKVEKTAKILLDHLNDDDYEMSLAGLYAYLTDSEP